MDGPFVDAAVIVRLVKFLWRGTVGILLVGAGLEVGRVVGWVWGPVRILVGFILQ